MNFANYCKNAGMTLTEYLTAKENIKATAEAIILYIKSNYKIDTGMYYPIEEIIKPGELTPYIIQELKNQGLECRENNTYWRF